MDIIEILEKNQRLFKIATIEKEIGLKPTILTRMIARKKINEIHRDKIEKWWNEFVCSLKPTTEISNLIDNRTLIIKEKDIYTANVAFNRFTIPSIDNKSNNANNPTTIFHTQLKDESGKYIDSWDCEKLEIKRNDEYPQYVIPKEKNQIIDFGNDKYLIIEKYTKYPLKNKPTNKFEQLKWLIEKKEADHQIKLAWEQFKR